MATNERDAARRFSGRAGYYTKYRPGYPWQVIEILRKETSLTAASLIADIGSGTGRSSALFLRNGNSVYAVEPNDEMRQAAESAFARSPAFFSIQGSAESTNLPAGKMDYVVAAQAFHWFDAQSARKEFVRILRPGGWVVLMWNTRRIDSTPFLQAWEALLQAFGTDYCQVRHRNIDDEVLHAFFAGGQFRFASVYNEQNLDFEALRGRLLSSSYVPSVGEPGCQAMLDELKRVFQEHQQGGKVRLEYDTELYFGRI